MDTVEEIMPDGVSRGEIGQFTEVVNKKHG